MLNILWSGFTRYKWPEYVDWKAVTVTRISKVFEQNLLIKLTIGQLAVLSGWPICYVIVWAPELLHVRSLAYDVSGAGTQYVSFTADI